MAQNSESIFLVFDKKNDESVKNKFQTCLFEKFKIKCRKMLIKSCLFKKGSTSMIILNYENGYQLSQYYYNKIVKEFISKNIKCPTCLEESLLPYGHKKKVMIINNEKVEIMLNVVCCQTCHKTHTILLDCMIPYCQYTLKDGWDIIKRYLQGCTQKEILNDYFMFDENTIKHIVSKYNKYYKSILTEDGLNDDEKVCLKKYGIQFLQTKNIDQTYVFDSTLEDWNCHKLSDKISV